MLQATQVLQQNTLQEAAFLASPTPMLAGTKWHMHRADFEAIADRAGADALRFFELQTMYRSRNLRQEHNIPLDVWPHEDDLWIDASCREIERETLHARSKSKYAQCLIDESPSEHAAKSLIQLGFLRRRIVARPGGDDAEVPCTTQYVDAEDRFIFVLDDKGNYIGDDGRQHNAVCEGWRVTRQYLFEFDKVNAALYALPPHFYALPKPLERWGESTIRRSDVPRRRREALTVTELTPGNSASADGKTSQLSGVSISSNGASSFRVQHNTTEYSMSRETVLFSLHDIELLRYAEWTPATLIGLASSILSVPLQDQVDEDTWHAEWYKPAERLINKTVHMPPVEAWRYIEAVVRFMLSEASWWSAPYDKGNPKAARAKKTPITLKNVANNLESQHMAMMAAHWTPETSTPYDGPQLAEATADYDVGYTGTEERQEASSVEAEVIEVASGESDTVPGELQESLEATVSAAVGMDDDELIELRRQLVKDYPEEALLVGDEPVAPGLSILFIEYALQCYLEFRNLDEYLGMPPEYYDIIEKQAIPYARTRFARQSSQGPPGIKESEEFL